MRDQCQTDQRPGNGGCRLRHGCDHFKQTVAQCELHSTAAVSREVKIGQVGRLIGIEYQAIGAASSNVVVSATPVVDRESKGAGVVNRIETGKAQNPDGSGAEVDIRIRLQSECACASAGNAARSFAEVPF